MLKSSFLYPLQLLSVSLHRVFRVLITSPLESISCSAPLEMINGLVSHSFATP